MPRPGKWDPSLRDGVTGNMSDFEFEDEGSSPSPAANLFHDSTRRFKLDSSNFRAALIGEPFYGWSMARRFNRGRFNGLLRGVGLAQGRAKA